MRFPAILFACALLGAIPSRTSLGGEAHHTGAAAVRPGDDFNAFANRAYLKTLRIPVEASGFGAVELLTAEVDQRIRAILDGHDKDSSPDLAKARALFHAFMNRNRVDTLGAKPVETDLAAVRKARTRAEVAALMGTSVRSFEASLFDLSIDADAKFPDRYSVILSQSGLGLPGRDYYLLPKLAPERAKYRSYIERMLTLAQWPDAHGQASEVLKFETRVAKASWGPTEERDPTKTYNPMTPGQLAAEAPEFDWADFLSAAGLRGFQRVVLEQDTAILRIAAVYSATEIETLKAWAAFHLLDNAAPYLARPFDEANLAFDEALTGRGGQAARWERAVDLVNALLGDAVGRIYVARFLPPDTRSGVSAMVANLRSAFAARIQHASWISPATREAAEQKLAEMSVVVGYPKQWHDYSGLAVRSDDLYGDVVRATAFEWDRRLGHLDQPVDRAEWDVTAQSLEAYYDPTRNEVVLPSGILQAPFFDRQAGDAVNYGAIGALIGHEMTHGFDDDGRHFDATGALRNWWTLEDSSRFEARAALLVAQYDQYEPYPGVHVNGRLTLGENIADLGGLLIAFDAYHRTLHGQLAPVVRSLTGDQRFFLAYARSWREKTRPGVMRALLASDPHAPEQFRVNGVLRNVDAWYQAFGVRPGDRLYLDPAMRTHIW